MGINLLAFALEGDIFIILEQISKISICCTHFCKDSLEQGHSVPLLSRCTEVQEIHAEFPLQRNTMECRSLCPSVNMDLSLIGAKVGSSS